MTELYNQKTQNAKNKHGILTILSATTSETLN